MTSAARPPRRLTPARVAAWSRHELQSFLYPYDLTIPPLLPDAALAMAFVERTTRPDGIPDALELPGVVGPTREAADVVALLSRVALDSSSLAVCYRLLCDRFMHAGTESNAEWPGMRWVLEALAEHPSCTLDTLASFAASDARVVLRHTRLAGRTLAADALPGCERCLAGFLDVLCLVDPGTCFGDTVATLRSACDMTLPGWCDLLEYELARLKKDDLTLRPGHLPFDAQRAAFDDATAALATVDHGTAPSVLAVIDQGATAPLADLMAACAAILSHSR